LPLLPSIDRFHYGIFLRDHLMLRYGLQYSSIRLSLLCICLRRSLGGRCLASACLQGVNCDLFVRNPCRSTTAYFSLEFGSVFFILPSIAFWQAVVFFDQHSCMSSMHQLWI
jgi:hypothetical protein